MGEQHGGRREWSAVWLWTVVCAGWLVFTWTWNAFHLVMTVDDTYYYFKTALNVGRGLGSSFDGINPTDGYHPLWLAFLAVVFKPLPDDMLLLTRVAITLQIGMVWLGGMILSRMRNAGGARVLWPLAIILIHPFAAKIVLCGQETALQFLLSSLAIARWWSLRESPYGYRPTQWAGLAVICALTTLARLDAVFFSLAILAMPLVLPGEFERGVSGAARLKMTVLGMVVFGCLIGGFLMYRLAVFHHLMPVSGAIKQHLDGEEVAPMAARIAAVVLAVSGTAGVWLAAHRYQSRVIALLVPPVTGALAVAIYNFGMRGEMSPSLVRIWYLEPFLFAGALILGTVLAFAWRRRPVAILFSGAVGIWLALCVFSWQYRFEDRSYNLYRAAERCARWVDAHPEVGTVGAAWDSGFVGAFTRKPLMNLDGLINSWDYKENYLDRGKVDEFILKRQPIDFLIQYAWPTTIRAIAARFDREPLPTAPRLQTSVSGLRDRSALSGRWGVDVASFRVAHVECATVSVAYDPTVTVGAVYYVVLSRAPLVGRPTFAEFALANRHVTTCDQLSRD